MAPAARPFLAARTTPRPRLLLAVFLVLGAAHSTLGWLFYRAETGQVRRQTEQELQAIADFKATQIGDWLARRRHDAMGVVGIPAFQEECGRWLGRSDPAARERLLARLETLRVDNYVGIELLDLDGRPRLIVGPVRNDSKETAPEEMQRFSRAAEPLLIDLHRDRSAGVIHFSYIVPIRRATDERLLGHLRLTIDPDLRLYPLIRSWPTPSNSGETYLVRREGDEVVYLNDLRHIPDTALQLRQPLARQELPAAHAARGETGFFEGVDYQGVAVFSYLRNVPGTPWQMVAKVDRAEVLDFDRIAWLAGLGVGAAIAFSGLLLWGVWARQRLRTQLEIERGLGRIAGLAPGVLYTFQLKPDGTRTFPYAAPGIADLTGFSPEQMARDTGPMRARIHPEDLQRIDEQIAESARTGKSWHEEFRYRHPGKGEIWLEGQSTPEYLPDGSIVWYGYFSDITARKQAEFELAESDRRYAGLFRNMLEGFALCRMRYEGDTPVDFIYLDVNPAFEQLTGLKDVVGKWVSEVIPGLRESNPDIFEVYSRVARGGQPEKLESYVPALGIWFSLAIFSPGPEQFVAVFDNVTDRKRVEEALRHRNEELEAIMESVPIPMFLAYDPSCRTITGNQAANALFAVSAGTNLSLSADRDTTALTYRVFASEGGSELAPEELPMQWAAFNAQPVKDRELYLRFDDGRALWLLGNAVPLFNARGKVRGVLAIYVDITESKASRQALENHKARLEQEVAARTVDLERMNQELQTFTYAASHDLKAPLRGINSFSALLERGYRDRLEGDGLLFLDTIRKNATRMTILIDDLLAHAQLEQQALVVRPVDLAAVVHTVLSEQEAEIRQYGAEIRLDLPEITVQADFQGFLQVLRNLVENALKYSGRQPRPVIEIGARQEAGHCRIWIRDNGVGFDMAYCDTIFEVFRRLHSYEEFPGSGIGLALVKKAVERMDGKVWAESEPGQGATFYLELPV